MVPPIANQTPEQIIKQLYIDEPGWHVHASLRWIDYADRAEAPMALHYAAFHLRYAIEQLWLTIFAAACSTSFSMHHYRQALRQPTKLYKLVKNYAPEYEKFAEFDQLIQQVDPKFGPRTVVWDNVILSRIHGRCSGKLLHVQKRGDEGYLSKSWILDRTNFLRESAQWMWNLMGTGGKVLVNYPNGLAPEPRIVWESFRDGEIDAESAKLRLQLIHPLISQRSIIS
jgi:hypothetical protein